MLNAKSLIACLKIKLSISSDKLDFGRRRLTGRGRDKALWKAFPYQVAPPLLHGTPTRSLLSIESSKSKWFEAGVRIDPQRELK